MSGPLSLWRASYSAKASCIEDTTYPPLL